jgi:hypothetical protein
MLSVLMTNIRLEGRTGTELATLDLAVALRSRGHRVAVFTPRLGQLAAEIMARGVPVTDRIDRIGFVPDIIHGHHGLTLAIALVRFPNSAAIFVCHDSSSPYDFPIVMNQIGAYVGVDPACTERLVIEGVPEHKIHLVFNGLNLDHLPLRPSWAKTPRTALAITKFNRDYIEVIRQACDESGLELDVVGPAVGREVSDLPELLVRADIVFAYSRGALEAAATGAAVIVCDEKGFGGLLTADEASRFPDSALGRRTLTATISAGALRAAIAAYDDGDARQVAQIVRQRFDLNEIRGAYERIYAQAIEANQRSPIAAERDRRELAAFLMGAAASFSVWDQIDLIRNNLAQREKLLEQQITERAMDLILNADRLRFGIAQPGLANCLLREGWSFLEDWGVWSDGFKSLLCIPWALIYRWNMRLVLAFKYYTPGTLQRERDYSMRIFVDGVLAATWTFEPGDSGFVHHRVLEIPEALRVSEMPDGVAQITLLFADPCSPSDAGEAPDPRLLSMGLVSVGASA